MTLPPSNVPLSAFVKVLESKASEAQARSVDRVQSRLSKARLETASVSPGYIL